MNTDRITDPKEARLAMRRREWTTGTTYKVPGYVQANLVVLSKSEAYDFLVYCQRNPKACPVIDITEPGDPEPKIAAPGADLRTDLPRYAVFRHGQKVEEPTEIRNLWQPDSVAFLIGSSLTFDAALKQAGVELSPTVWVLRTTIETLSAGKFRGKLVVTMRLMSPHDAITATQLTARFYRNHGAPMHLGNPFAIGADVARPIFGPPIEKIPSDKIPVFWACGVTPQQVAFQARLPLLITHAPGHAFITDLKAAQFCQP